MSKTKKKQTELDGFEAPNDADLDKAVAAYRTARDERMELTKAEVKTRDALVRLLREKQDSLDTNAAGDPCYRFQDGEDVYIATLHSSEKLKVKKVSDEPPELSVVG